MEKIGLGCVTFGREIDSRESFAIMDYAAEKHIFFWDTAAVYGNGASEKLIGQWLNANKKIAEQVKVSTKIPTPYTSDSIIETVSQSLHRMKRSYIDILYLHNWDESIIKNGTFKTLDHLIKTGSIKSIGLSNFTGAQIRTVFDYCHEYNVKEPAYIQNNHNFAVSDITPDMWQLSADQGVDIITYSPLGAGYLTGKHTAGVVAGSRFDMVPAHQQIYFAERSQHRMYVLIQAADEIQTPPANLALAWAFDQPFVSKVLIGVREKKHIDQSIEVMKFIKNYRDPLSKLEQTVIKGA